MAPLTWRNVHAPDFSGVSQSQRLVADLLRNSFSGLQDSIGRFQDSRNQARTTEDIAAALRYQDPAQLRTALESGEISGRTLEGLNFLATRPEQLLRDEGLGLENVGRGLINTRRQQDIDVGAWEFGTRKQDRSSRLAREAAQRDLMPLVFEARNHIDSGDPARVEMGRRMIGENLDRLGAAGWTAESLLTRMDEFRDDALSGFEYSGQARSQASNLAARSLVDEALSRYATPEQGIQHVINSDASREAKQSAIASLQQAAESGLYNRMTPIERELMSLGVSPQSATGSTIPTETRQPSVDESETASRALTEAARPAPEPQGTVRPDPEIQGSLWDQATITPRSGSAPSILGPNLTEEDIEALRTRQATEAWQAVPDMIPGADHVRDNLQVSPTSVTTIPSVPEVMPSRAVSPAELGRTMRQEAQVDDAFNPDEALARELVERPNRNVSSMAEMARILTGEGGTFEGENYQAILQALNETASMAEGISPDIAGLIVERSAESRDLSNFWGDPGDSFGEPTDGRRATRIDPDRIRNNINKLMKRNDNGNFEIRTEVLNNAQRSQEAATQTTNLISLDQRLDNYIRQLQEAIITGQDTPENRQALAQAMEMKDQVGARMFELHSNSLYRPGFVSGRTGLGQ